MVMLRGKKTGAHFLIANDGTIYQTASLEKLCWHVGILYSRCADEKSCGVFQVSCRIKLNFMPPALLLFSLDLNLLH